MKNPDTEAGSPQERIRELQDLLGDLLPELVAFYEYKKARTDRSAVHQGNARELRELINRVARQLGKPPVQAPHSDLTQIGDE